MNASNMLAIALTIVLAGVSCNLKPLPVEDQTPDDLPTAKEEAKKEEVKKEEPKAAEEEPQKEEEPQEEEKTAEPALETEEQPEPPTETSKGTGYGGKVISTLSLKADAGSVVVFLTAEKADYKGKDAYMEFGCESLLVPVKVSLTKTQSDLAEALVQLITIKQNAYAEQGLRNAVAPSAPTIRLTNIHYEGKTRVIDFEGSFLSAGTCDDPRIKAQIEETVKLYSDNYQIRLNGEEKQWRCLFDASGTCS